jgi:TRAP-type C4-dicarboxylate transport system permease large subunit
VLEVARSVAPFLVIMLGMLFLITYVPWISLVLTRFVG